VGVLERVIEDVRDHVSQLPGLSLDKRGDHRCNEKLNAANSFYADHAQVMQTEVGRLARLVSNITQDKTAMNTPHMGRLIQYVDVLNQDIDTLVQFSTQNWHDHQHQTVFDLNTVLDAISSTSVPFLKENGIELIFEVSNDVPAQFKGYSLGMINVLVSLLELLVQAKVQGKLIMRIALAVQPENEEAILSFGFMQSHYLGSTAHIGLSEIEHDRQFKRLLDQMKEIEGSISNGEGNTDGRMLQLGFKVQTLDRRSYHLPSKEIMDKAVLIIDDRQKNAEILQGMLQYFHLTSLVSTRMDEAMAHIRDHTYDAVIVTERLAKQCAKSCKQLSAHEKFIVLNTKKGGQGAYLGLDLADSFLNEPYTHKGIFNAIVDVFSDESVEGRMEDVTTLKSYLSLLSKNRRLLYIGNSDMTIRSTKMFLEEIEIQQEMVEAPSEASLGAGEYDFVLQMVDPNMLRNDMDALGLLLKQGRSLSKDKRVVCVVAEELDETELEKIASFAFVITYLQEPIDPEAFYKVLLDWALGT
jgi:CheY-like chemotaxis protein